MSKPNLGRILRWVWTVIGGILTFVGLGGAPDDIEGRKQIFDSINTDAIAAFLAGDGGRWTTFIAGISLVVAANRGTIRSLFPSTNRDLPDSNDNAPTVTIYRHILAPRDEIPFNQIRSLFEQAGWKVIATATEVERHARGLWIHGGASTDRASAQWGRSTLGLIADVDDHDDSPPTLQIIIGADAGDSTSLAKRKSNADEAERRQLQDALRNCKKEYAESTLRWFAQRAQINIEKHRLQDPSVKDIRATVRFAEYKDLDLAKDVVKILKECTAWPVELDGSNKPTILPDGDFKVSFDIGSWESFRKVAWAFTYGQLVPGKIGHRGTERFDDRQHLIVDVLPTVKQ